MTMGNKVAELIVRVTSDIAGDIGGDLSDIGRGAVSMADDVEKSSGRAAAGVERLGAGAEGLDDKFGRAAGAAGALSSGADLIGNEKASAALQTMALATDFFSGVGQVGILVTEALSVATVENEAATVSNTIATKAAAVGAKAWTIAQAALNAVLDANPVILLVIALAGLVIGFKLLYDHSERFRSIVQAVGKVGAAALSAVLGVVKDVVSWVGKVADKFGFLGDVVHVYVFVAKTELQIVVGVIGFVVDKVSDLIGKFGDLKSRVGDALGYVGDKARDIGAKLLKPFTSVKNTIDDIIDLVDNLIDRISHIHIPHIDLNPLSKAGGSGGRTTDTGTTYVYVTFDPQITVTAGAGDVETADSIVDALSRSADRLGQTIAQRLGVTVEVVPA